MNDEERRNREVTSTSIGYLLARSQERSPGGCRLLMETHFSLAFLLFYQSFSHAALRNAKLLKYLTRRRGKCKRGVNVDCAYTPNQFSPCNIRSFICRFIPVTNSWRTKALNLTLSRYVTVLYVYEILHACSTQRFSKIMFLFLLL